MMSMSLAYTISTWNRRRKWRLFLSHVSPTPTTRVLDVGFSEKEYSESDNFLEKHYPFPEHITALGLEEAKKFSLRYPKVKTVVYDGGRFPFPDNSFDLCWSNAVVEHVGGASAQVAFLKEIRRVATHGFVTTPNRLFPIEVHTRLPLLHILLPRRLFHGVLGLLGKEWATGDYMHLLSHRELTRCLHAAGFTRYEIVKNRLCGFTLDFVVIF